MSNPDAMAEARKLRSQFNRYLYTSGAQEEEIDGIIAAALTAARASALEEAANAVWSERWEPPYDAENRAVKAIRSLALDSAAPAKCSEGELDDIHHLPAQSAAQTPDAEAQARQYVMDVKVPHQSKSHAIMAWMNAYATLKYAPQTAARVSPEVDALRDAARELVEILDDAEARKHVDSFTPQPLKLALAALDAAADCRSAATKGRQ